MRRVWVIEAPGKKDALLAALRDAGFERDSVLATFGRLYDLPADAMGFDPKLIGRPDTPAEITWKPRRQSQVRKLIDMLAKADHVLIATDGDLEGELIASQVQGLCDRAQSHYKCEQVVQRVHLGAFTPDHVKEGFRSRTDINTDKVRAAKARRVLDRLLGYRLHDPDDSWRMSMGRVVSPLVNSLLETPAESALLRKALPDGWHAVLRLPSRFSADADSLLGVLHGLPPPSINVTHTTEHIYEHKPLTGPEALKLCMRKLNAEPGDIQSAIQSSYEKGRLSYPRSDSRTMGELARLWVTRMSAEHGVECDPALVEQRQSERLERSYDAHEALLPVGSAMAASSIPDQFLSLEESVIRAIGTFSMKIGEPAEIFKRETGELDPFATSNSGWLKALGRYKEHLSIVRDVDQHGFQVDPLRHELQRKPTKSEAGVELWRHNVQQMAVERLIDLGLGRPSTVMGLAQKTIKTYLDEHGNVNGRGRIMIQRVLRRLPELLDPAVSRQVESVVSDVSEPASIADRLDRAWAVLKRNPLITVGSETFAMHDLPVADTQSEPGKTKPEVEDPSPFQFY